MLNESGVAFYRRVRRKIDRIRLDRSRTRLRREVAFTAPSPRAADGARFSSHMLVCRQDLLLSVCSAKSLNLALEEPLPWVFHDDGTLTDSDVAMLHRHFPGCNVVARARADSFYDAHADVFPSLRLARRQHVMLLKLADLFVFGSAERILYVDSDILFFRRPAFLVEALNERGATRNYISRDLGTCYVATPSVLKELTGIAPCEALNAGLSVLNRKDIPLESVDRLLALLDSRKRDDWSPHYSHLIEQTTLALLASSSPSGVAHLPAEYDLSLDKQPEKEVCKHYVGVIRHDYELEGLRYLTRTATFLERWRQFASQS